MVVDLEGIHRYNRVEDTVVNSNEIKAEKKKYGEQKRSLKIGEGKVKKDELFMVTAKAFTYT